MPDIPKINTDQMSSIVKELIRIFRGVDRTTSLWICGRSKSFGFRPSLEKNYLSDITKDWVKKLEDGKVVVTPIVFYTCDANDIEKTDDKADKEAFLVYHHYNIFTSWKKADGSIVLERYEPANVEYQGDLNSRLEKLLVENMVKYTKRKIEYTLVAEKGLQNKYKDTTLCGHHILYWMVYRLKYGLDKATQLLGASDSVNEYNDTSERFNRFCQCMTDYKIDCMDEV